MTKRLIYVVLLLLILAVAVAEDTGIACSENSDCAFCDALFGESCTCSVTCQTLVRQGDTTTGTGTTGTGTTGTGTTDTATTGTGTTDTANTGTGTTDTATTGRVELSASTSQIEALDGRVADLESMTSGMQLRVSGMEGRLEQLSKGQQNLKLEQGKIKQELGSDLQAVATGLAGLQTSVANTQNEVESLETTFNEQPGIVKIIAYLLAIILAIVIILGILYFVEKTRKPSSHITEEIMDYISQHISTGKKYHHIRDHLVNAGWSHDDVKKAYKATAKRNNKKFQNSKPGASVDKMRIFSILGVSLLLVVGIFFLLKGVTGQAIAFKDEAQLQAAVESHLNNLLDNSPFYPLVETGNFCLQIEDSGLSLSYQVLRTLEGHEWQRLREPCSVDLNHDFAFKFNSWNTFDILVRKSSCKNFVKQHGNYYVLPSKYVRKGFTLVPGSDPAPFCAAIAVCEGVLSDVSRVGYGVLCPS